MTMSLKLQLVLSLVLGPLVGYFAQGVKVSPREARQAPPFSVSTLSEPRGLREVLRSTS